MKNKRFSLATAALTGILAAAIFAVPAMAATEIDVTKTVTGKSTTYTPVETFEFTVANGSADSLTGLSVYAGVDGGVTVGTVSYDGEELLGETGVTKTTKLTLNASAFERPGIYHYTLAEKEGSNDLITYATNTYDVYAYIYTEEANNTIVVVDAGISEITDQTAKNEPKFTNDYDENTSDRTHTAAVTKTITGNQAVTTDKFSFEVKVVSDSNYEKNYTVEFPDGTTQKITKDVSVTKELTNNETIKVYGLTSHDTVTITETDANKDGYKTTVVSPENIAANEANTGVSGTISADATATVNNDKTVSTPTGIVMTYAPYFLMAALAVVLAFFFLRRRNREEI